MLSEKQINNFKRNGYIVIPNFLDQEEIGELSTSLEESKNTQQKKTNYNVLDDEKVWDFLCNKNLKKILSLIIGPEVYYLHDVSLLYGEIDSKYTWHRDNPCRRTGIGPDWSDKEEYNVVSTAVYLCDSKKTQSSLSVIPKSHLLNKHLHSLQNLQSLSCRSVFSCSGAQPSAARSPTKPRHSSNRKVRWTDRKMDR